MALAMSLVTASCTSWSTLHPARTVGQGRTEWVVAPELLGAPSGALPSVEAYFRHGLADNVDLGVKFFPIGFGIDVNIMLVKAGAFALSLDPTLNGTFFSFGTNTDSQGNQTSNNLVFASVWLPLLMDVVTTDVVTLTLGPKVGYMYLDGQSADARVQGLGGVSFGGSVALRLQLSPGFALVPELAVITSRDAWNTSSSAVAYNANIGFAF